MRVIRNGKNNKNNDEIKKNLSKLVDKGSVQSLKLPDDHKSRSVPIVPFLMYTEALCQNKKKHEQNVRKMKTTSPSGPAHISAASYSGAWKVNQQFESGAVYQDYTALSASPGVMDFGLWGPYRSGEVIKITKTITITNTTQFSYHILYILCENPNCLQVLDRIPGSDPLQATVARKTCLCPPMGRHFGRMHLQQ